MTFNDFKAIVERICGPVAEWPSTPTTAVKFRLENPLPSMTLLALSEALGVEVVWPIPKKPKSTKTVVKMGSDFGDVEG